MCRKIRVKLNKLNIVNMLFIMKIKKYLIKDNDFLKSISKI